MTIELFSKTTKRRKNSYLVERNSDVTLLRKFDTDGYFEMSQWQVRSDIAYLNRSRCSVGVEVNTPGTYFHV